MLAIDNGAGDEAPLSTREVIVREAVTCFADAGFEGTSLNDIAAAVGIRRPSLLHHFPSKDALYEEVFERVLSDWLERLDEAVRAPGEGWSRVEMILRAGFRLFEDTPDYVRLMRREALDGGSHLGMDLGAVLRPLFDAAVDFLDREMRAGVFRVHDPRQLVIMAYGAILTYFSDAPLIDGLIDEEALKPDNIADHREHVIGFFRAALVG